MPEHPEHPDPVGPLTAVQVATARGRLHALVCQSRWWSDDCRRAGGGRHARETWPAGLIRELAADPAALHERLCIGDLQAHAVKAPGYACTGPAQHAAALHHHVFPAGDAVTPASPGRCRFELRAEPPTATANVDIVAYDSYS